MGGIGSRIAVGLAVAMATLVAMSGAAGAGTTIVASPVGFTFEPGPYVQDLGEVATFDNSQSTAPHDVTSTQRGPDGKPLFFAPGIAGGMTNTVKGTQYLGAGTYPFFCTIHGSTMSGDLTIDGRKGTVVPRPSIRVAILKQRLKKVRRSGLNVRIRAVTASGGVAVLVRKGRTVLGSRRGLAFEAGQVRTVKVPLTKAGRRAIRKGKSAKVTARATVPFGKTSVASRKLR